MYRSRFYLEDRRVDRRAFFTKGVGKAAKAISEHTAKKARENAEHWIRPPFAIEELDFLLACSRCGDCIKACPHDVIFPLPSRLGAKVFSTPGMNLVSQGCHLCEDWPCVQACEPKALLYPVEKTALDDSGQVATAGAVQLDQGADSFENKDAAHQKRILPKIATVFINKETCLPYSGPECGACRVCPVPGAMTWYMEKPEINQALCTGCALCREACIVEPKAVHIQSIYKTLEQPAESV